MKRLLFCVLLVVGIGGVAQFVDCVVSAQAAKAAETDAQIKQDIINRSIAAYAGSCPCPYSIDRAGQRCGRRSAHSRPGGASPRCYPGDVTQKMVDDYRAGREKRTTTRPRRPKILQEGKHRKELLREGVESLLAGDVGTGKAILRDYINATS